MVIVRVLSGPNRGCRLRLNLSRFVEPTYLYGTYDKPILTAAKSLNLSGKVVWDCGTYLGFYTIFFARTVGPNGKVVAFEPDPENLGQTRFNCALNRLTNVEFREVAIGAKVRCVSLDEMLSEGRLPPPDLIKIDIEGAEITALDYMENMAGKIRPKIILETHNPECDRKAFEFARRFNYRLSSIESGKRLSRVEEMDGTLLCEPI
jgi:precorrin-6B methylase 2